MKICTKCKEEKEITEFPKGKNQCRKCRNIKMKEYTKEYRKNHKDYQKNYDKTHKKVKTIDIICLNCGQPAKAYKCNKGKFCSPECSRKYLVGENAYPWLGGISYEPYCPLFNKNLKERVRSFFEYRCLICGKHQNENLTKTTNKNTKLSVHHVNYDKNSCCDGKPVHFAALCTIHHIITNYDRERWESMLHRIINEIYNGRSYYTKDEFAKIENSKDQKP